MIDLTRLNGSEIVVNADLIEMVESTPDTVVSLTTGKKLVVLESPNEVVELVIRYRQKTAAALTEAGATRAPRAAAVDRTP